MKQEKLTLLQHSQLWLAELMSVLPIPLTSAIGDYVGRQIAKKALRENIPWTKDIHNNFRVLRSIESVSQREQEIIAWAGRVGRVHTEFTVLQRLAKENRVEIVGWDNLENTTQPIIFVSCHLSNWELLAHVATKLPRITCDLYVPPQNLVYRRVATQARQDWQAKIDFIEFSPRAIFQLARGLADGKNLLLFIDEEKDGYIWGPSLGRELPYSGNRWLAARLAIRHQVDIVPSFVEQVDESHYRIVIEPKLQRSNGDAESCARYLADQMDERMDQWVRERLEQWYWLSWLDLDKPLPHP